MANMRGSPTLSPRSASTGQRLAVVAILAVAFGVVASSAACGTDPVGVEACRKIERVRCESAPECGIDLGRPLHSGNSPEKDVAACIRYYDDQCLHGLVITKEPSPQAVDACVNEIITGDCSVVRAPETSPACSFLIPPAPAPPAPTVDASDEASEASADATTDGG
jgi:hypothetical protein